MAPVISFGVLRAFIVYATWAAFVNGNYYYKPYISPFYSPCLATVCGATGSQGAEGVPHLEHLRALVDHLAGHHHPDLPARVPPDLLLLPPGLLPGLLAVAAGVRGGRARTRLHR